MVTSDVTDEEAGDRLEMIMLSVNGRMGEAEQHDRASRHGGATQSSARAPASEQGGGRRAAQAGHRLRRILMACTDEAKRRPGSIGRLPWRWCAPA